MKVLVTGGCGFIGSNFINFLLNGMVGVEVVNVDKKTYAGRGDNLEHLGVAGRCRTVVCDIADSRVYDVFREERPDMIVNFAAESHVDNSIANSEPFVMTNDFGTYNLLKCAYKWFAEGLSKRKDFRFLQVSTDEVYGSLGLRDPSSKETDSIKPRSPYSASKMNAENWARAYFETFGLPVVITRGSNNYGPYQHPEKLVPKFITNLKDGKKVPLMWSEYNPGLNTRDWIYVEDHCSGIWTAATNGIPGETYNVGGNNERTNLEITRFLLESFGYGDEMIERVPHRAGHDFRYSLDSHKLERLGWRRKYTALEEGMKQTVDWYKGNESWWRKLL